MQKRPGSPKQRAEKPDKSSAKPPLPKYSLFHIRKGVFHATLDFVQSLCDTSSGLTDIFPMEDRRQALQEVCVLSSQLDSLGQLYMGHFDDVPYLGECSLKFALNHVMSWF